MLIKRRGMGAALGGEMEAPEIGGSESRPGERGRGKQPPIERRGPPGIPPRPSPGGIAAPPSGMEPDPVASRPPSILQHFSGGMPGAAGGQLTGGIGAAGVGMPGSEDLMQTLMRLLGRR